MQRQSERRQQPKQNKKMLVTEKQLFYSENELEYLDEITQEAKNGEWTLKEFARELKFLHERIGPFFELSEIPNRCFCCGEDLKMPSIMWNGCHGTDDTNSTPIWFHPECANRFSESLQRDYAKFRDYDKSLKQKVESTLAETAGKTATT